MGGGHRGFRMNRSVGWVGGVGVGRGVGGVGVGRGGRCG